MYYFLCLQELEKKQEELKSSITDLRKEINQRLHEIKSLKEDLESIGRRNDNGAKELESYHDQVESLKVIISPNNVAHDDFQPVNLQSNKASSEISRVSCVRK